MKRVTRLLLVITLALAPVATGAVGYYLGTTQGQTSPTSYAAWTDQEIKSLGGNGNYVSVRCSYHLVDGTVRVVETVTQAFDAQRAGRTMC